MQPDLFVPLAASALACLAVGLLVWGLFGRLAESGRGEALRGRLSRVSGAAAAAPGARGTTAETPEGIRRVVAGLGRRLGPKGGASLSHTRQALVQAGLRSENAAAVLFGAKALLAMGLGGGFLFLRSALWDELSMPATAALVIGLALVGSYLPEWWLRKRVASRRMSMADELPDALDLLVVCVESGMGLDQAINRVSSEMKVSAPLISTELRTLTLQLRGGKPRPEALRELSDRVGLDDLNSLTTLLVQADIFGISVGQTLRVFSDSLRTKRFQRAEELAAKLPVKLLIPMILFIFPALFIAIMGPAGLHLMDVMTKLNK